MTKVTESQVLAAVKSEAKRHKLICIRLAFRVGVTAGWPDTLVLGPNGGSLLLELKRPGKPLQKLQEHRFEELQAFGQHVAKIDTVQDAHATVLRFAAMCYGAMK